MSRAVVSLCIGVLLLVATPAIAFASPTTQESVTASELQALMKRVSELLTELRGLQNQLLAAEKNAPVLGGADKLTFERKSAAYQLTVKTHRQPTPGS